MPQVAGHPYSNVVGPLLAAIQAVSAVGGWAKNVAQFAVFLKDVAQQAHASVVVPSSPTEVNGSNGARVTPPDAGGQPNQYELVGDAGSPDLASVTLPSVDGVGGYMVSQLTDGTWSTPSAVAPNTEFALADGTTGIRFSAVDPSGVAMPLASSDGGLLIDLTFASSGDFNGALTDTLAPVHWNSASGQWSAPANWAGGATPGIGAQAVIDAAGTYTVTLAGQVAETLVTLAAAGATVADKGTLTLGGQLEVSAGRFQLAKTGTILGGALLADGGAFVWKGGTLDETASLGPLDLSAAHASVQVADWITLTDAAGTGPGTVMLTGAGSRLTFIGTQTVDNATIEIGAAAGAASLTSADPQALGATLTLGPNLTIDQAGAKAAIGGAGGAGDGIVNQGTIVAAFAGGRFTVSAANFTNDGRITVANGDRLSFAGALANGGVLEATGGTLTAMGDVAGAGTATIAGGDLIFDGAFSQDVAFTGSSGTLRLARSQSYGGAITGFSQAGGTSLDLADIAFTGPGEASFSGDTTSGVLTVSDGTHTAAITLIGDYTGSSFVASDDGHGGVTIVDPAGPPAPPPIAPPGSADRLIAAMAGLGARPGDGLDLGRGDMWRPPFHAFAAPSPHIA